MFYGILYFPFFSLSSCIHFLMSKRWFISDIDTRLCRDTKHILGCIRSLPTGYLNASGTPNWGRLDEFLVENFGCETGWDVKGWNCSISSFEIWRAAVFEEHFGDEAFFLSFSNAVTGELFSHMFSIWHCVHLKIPRAKAAFLLWSFVMEDFPFLRLIYLVEKWLPKTT